MERFGLDIRRSHADESGLAKRVFRSFGLVVLFAAGGIGNAHSAASPQTFGLAGFFRGQFDGTGTETDTQHAAARAVSFSGKGVGIPGGIRLAYDIVFSDGERQHRVWTFTKTSDGHYVGLRDDVIGTAAITKIDNGIHLSYTARVATKSGTRNLNFNEDFKRTAPGTLVNTFKATYLFFTVASGQVTVQKLGH